MARHSRTSPSMGRRLIGAIAATAALARGVMGDQVLSTSGFTDCGKNSSVSVQKVNISYNNDNKTVTFDVKGTSTAVQNVTATLNVTAYGQQVYSNSFNPCDAGTFVAQLCPVPIGTFSASGSQAIPAQYANMVPAIAFQIPDIAAQATLQLKSLATGDKVACIQSQVSNGKTASIPAVSYVAAGVAGAALVVGGFSAVSGAIAGAGAGSAGSVGGLGTPSPSFGEVFGWFHGMAMNGMLSVNYPHVYRSFSKNFGFATGLIPWNALQMNIDNFRRSTGGNLTQDNVQFLQNATLVFADGSTDQLGSKVKRAFDMFVALAPRDITTSVSSSTNTTSSTDSGSGSSVQVAVKGIKAYVEELSIPSANVFMTVLLIVAIIIAAIAVGILFLKVILEFWALFGSFPKSLSGFRKHYWGSIARAVTNLILLLYGVWVLYCIFQFTQGDSWAAKTLAGVTLALFTGILVFFSYKIWSTARRLRAMEGDVSALYEDKSIWTKYSLFYESYRKDYWWIFVPTIIYLFAKGCILAAADGHGMVQTIAQLVVEALMLILLIWSRPYERRSGNVINIVIAVVRVLSVVCILVFVEEFAIAETTQTVAGVVLIAIQSALTGILAILIAWNAIVACCKENPHRKRRKELEKKRSMDNLTPLDPHNSLLRAADTKLPSYDIETKAATIPTITSSGSDDDSLPHVNRNISPDRFGNNGSPPNNTNPYYAPQAQGHTRNLSARSGDTLNYAPAYNRPVSPATPYGADQSLVSNAAPIGQADMRQPTLPVLGGGFGGGMSPSPSPGPGPGPGQGANAQPYGGSRPYTGSYGQWRGY